MLGKRQRDEDQEPSSKRMRLRSAAIFTKPPGTRAGDDAAAEAKDDPSRPKLLDLPEDVILHILSYLPLRDLVSGVRCASPYLHNLSLHPCLWRRLTIDLGTDMYHGCHTSALLKFCSKLLKQRCGMFSCGLRRVTPSRSCKAAVNGEPGGIEELGRSAWVKKSVASSVSTLCEKIPCDACLMNAEVKNPVSITQGVRYENLKHLSLRLFHNHIPRMAFLSKHRMLRSLSLEWECQAVSLRDPRPRNLCKCPHNLGELFQCIDVCKDLETLTITRSSISTMIHMPALRAEMISYFAKGPYLTHLNLCLPVSDSVVKAIVGQCTQLQTLKLSCTPLGVRAFAPLLDNSPNRSVTKLTLDCHIVDPSMVYAISAGFQALTELQLRFVPGDTVDENRKLMQAVAALTVPDLFPKLTDLEVNIQSDCYNHSLPDVFEEDANDSPPPIAAPPSLPFTPVSSGMLSRVSIDVQDIKWYSKFEWKYLLTCHHELRQLILIMQEQNRPFALPDSAVDLLTSTCQQLETLSLRRTLSWKQLLVLRSIPGLRSLDCRLGSEGQNLPAVKEKKKRKTNMPAAKKNPQKNPLPVADLQDKAQTPTSSLMHLCIWEWHAISCQNLVALSQLFPGLVSLNIFSRVLITQHVSTILRVFNAQLEDLKLRLLGTPWEGDPNCNADDCLQLLLTARPPKLREVSFEKMLFPTSPALLAKVLVHSPSLEVLKLTVDPCIYDDSHSTFNDQLVFAAVRREIVKRRRQQGQMVQVTRENERPVAIYLQSKGYMWITFNIKRDRTPPSSSPPQFLA